MEKKDFFEAYSRIDAEVLCSDRRFTNITELLLFGEGYITKAMRCAGAEEKFVSGDASDYEKLRELCRTAPLFRGNPAAFVCEYILPKLFDCRLALCPENCDEIWRLTADKLTEKPLTALDLLKLLGIAEITALTDISAELSCFGKLSKAHGSPRISISLCPDTVLDIGKRGYKRVITLLGAATGVKITDISSFDAALRSSLDRFAEAGCRSAAMYGLCTDDFGENDYYHAELSLKRSIETDGHLSEQEQTAFRRYAVGQFVGLCRERGLDLMLEFSDKPIEFLRGITLAPPSRRRAWLNFGEKPNVPKITEGFIDPAGDIYAQLKVLAGRGAIGMLPPFSVGTENIAELCLHAMVEREKDRFLGGMK